MPDREAIRAAYLAACRDEIEAPKPGNVHRFADGHDMTASQFLASAAVSAGPLTDPKLSTGRRILEAVRATRRAVGINTNLGILLLCGPLARAAEWGSADLRTAVAAVLRQLDMDDARAVFEAIALAQPGGLGTAERHDVRQPPTISLLEAMAEAAGRDMIARQYVTGFEDVLGAGLAAQTAADDRGESPMWRTVFVYLGFLSCFPDSHVARKHGGDVAQELRDKAAEVLPRLAAANEQDRLATLLDLDRRLKVRGLNPGTSADLTVATLFACGLRYNLRQLEAGD